MSSVIERAPNSVNNSCNMFYYIFETAVSAFQPKVDRESGIIYNVCILGPTSHMGGLGNKIRRVYTEECMQKASHLYENTMVNVDHPESLKDDRKFEKRLGKLVNVRCSNNKLYGDLVFYKTHPLSDRICEAAEKPELRDTCGFSHVAKVESVWKDGIEIVNSIKHVYSVDLVADSATTQSLFESLNGESVMLSENNTNSVLDSLIQQFAEGKMDANTFKKGVEEAMIPPVPPEKCEEEEGKEEDGEENEEKDKKNPFGESKKCAWEEAIGVLESVGAQISQIRVKALCSMEGSSEDIKKLAESWVVSESRFVKPKSGTKMESTAKGAENKPDKYSDVSQICKNMFRR